MGLYGRRCAGQGFGVPTTSSSGRAAIAVFVPWCLGAAVAACAPLYPDAIAPADAKFSLSCVEGCGAEGADRAVAIDVSFAKGTYGRQLAFCCGDRDAILAQLKTASDFWCDGLDVPAKEVGGLVIATSVSPTTGDRGVTIDGGEGYVAFNCDAWLPQLIEQLRTTPCCNR